MAGEAIKEARFGIDAHVTIDAIIMAMAAQLENPVIYTSDMDDLARFQTHFRSVKLLSWDKR